MSSSAETFQNLRPEAEADPQLGRLAGGDPDRDAHLEMEGDNYNAWRIVPAGTEEANR